MVRAVLGAELRRLREEAGISAAAAAYHIRGSESKISRLERGRQAVKVADIEDLLFHFDVTDEEVRAHILELADRASRPGWWNSFSDILPDWFQQYVGLEQSATRIRTFEPQYIPGLLQTEDYAAAVIALGDFRGEQFERRVELRRQRQRRFHEGELRLWAIIDEGTLRRAFGDRDVMRAQLEYLLVASKSPDATVQVLPFAAGGHAVPGAYSLLRFPDPRMPDVAYVEALTSASYIDRRDEVDAYTLAMDRLSIMAAHPDDSRDLIISALAEM
jgi:transcriptional regulator with XRE-family HTH domain